MIFNSIKLLLEIPNNFYGPCKIKLKFFNFIFDDIHIETYKIENIESFLKLIKQNFDKLLISEKVNIKNDVALQIKDNNQKAALGCLEHCPYCGVKCSEKLFDIPHYHKAKEHRLMSFKGCNEYLENGKRGFIFDMCNSDFNLQQSKWMDVNNTNKNTNFYDPEFKIRFSKYSIGTGQVEINLKWDDYNDLDLYCICPCGTKIYYNQKKCDTCDGYLDLDMNVCNCLKVGCNRCSISPAEHIYFKTAKNGTYKVWVQCKNSTPKNGGNTGVLSNFQVEIKSHDGLKVDQVKNLQMNLNSDRKVDVSTFNHSSAITFFQHVEKFNEKWKQMEPSKNSVVTENILKNAFYLIKDDMSKCYSLFDNTPESFHKK